MSIEKHGNQLILTKDDNLEVDISDGEIIQYSAIYYKKMIDDFIDYKAEIPTMFIGKINCNKYHNETGYQGIYVDPLYIWSNIHYKWYKIINLTLPKSKYFLYPHLLLLPHIHCNYKSFYTLNSCEKKSLDDFTHITDTIELSIPNY
jgi:hypothetical protein